MERKAKLYTVILPYLFRLQSHGPGFIRMEVVMR